jgi:hypothetical protein
MTRCPLFGRYQGESGPSRHFAAAQQIGRFLSEADIIRQANRIELIENNPNGHPT